MKNLVLLLLLVLISVDVGAQASPQLRFDEANDLLENGDYRQALREYRAIEHSENISGPLYLNMGIAAVQIDSLGLAKFYFLHAQKFEITAESANRALDFVNSQFSRQSASLPKLPWDRAVDYFKVSPGTFGLFVIGYCVFCLALLLTISRWFKLLSIPKEKNVIVSLFVMAILIITLAYYVDYVDQRYDEAVLITEDALVSTTPDENAELVSMAYEGYDLIIDWKKSTSSETWYYIRLGNGQYGWIKTKGIKIL